ncbi:hypothetical protein AUP41_00800 [Thalassospira xiamenensis]|nr:hypothetical protein AUP41_00800 [Thalassospira xiamenensis]
MCETSRGWRPGEIRRFLAVRGALTQKTGLLGAGLDGFVRGLCRSLISAFAGMTVVAGSGRW